MRRATTRAVRLAAAVVAAAAGNGVQAADGAAPGPRRVELPPMLVEESTTSVPWLYAKAGGTEFLSRCSAGTTRALAEAWLEKLQLVRTLVPEEFLGRMDVPAVFVLYAQDSQSAASEEIRRELQVGRSRADGVNIAPSMRLADRDTHASIAYIDEALFDGATLSVSPGHVRHLMRGRVPELPAWFVDGMERVYRSADFVLEPVTLRPLGWLSAGESAALAGDAARPREILTGRELFTGETVRSADGTRARRAAVRAATEELFVRWATTAGGATRAALGRLVARAAEGAVTEEIFEEIFGFDYAELRDRLSDYLPVAVEETIRLRPGRLPPPRIELEPATPNQIARVRGEWERLAIGHVVRRMPEVREPYLMQARRTLRRAYDAGDRDPRLLATMGLVEIEAGETAAARGLLEAAVAAGVVRPRAYYELARLRWEERERAGGGERSGNLAFAEVAPIVDILRKGLAQAPALPEGFALLGEVWTRSAMGPNAAETDELLQGLRLFGRRPEVAWPIAEALARHGRRAEAVAALDGCAGRPADDATRAGMARLRGVLAAGSAGTAEQGGGEP